ncbi:hypothetical protein ACXJJ3_14185 [Kribbella sp. WER1]
MSALRQHVTTTRAADLARQGDLSGAAALLTGLDDPSVEALDLLARIRAQQKQWVEADALWAKVEQTAGSPAVQAAAADGRRMVAAIRGRRRAARPVLPVVAGVVLVGAVVAGGALLDGRSTPVAEPVPPTVTASVDTEAEERAAELQRQLAVLEAQKRAAAAAVASQLDVIQKWAAGPGVVVQRGQGAVRVVFVDAVFTSGTDLSPTGQTALTALGKRLTGLNATTTVTGYSVVVPGSPKAGGSRMGLLRARVATQQLSAASGLPLTAFAMQSGDQAHPPYRTAAKNRTVTVTLAPVTER